MKSVLAYKLIGSTRYFVTCPTRQTFSVFIDQAHSFGSTNNIGAACESVTKLDKELGGVLETTQHYL